MLYADASEYPIARQELEVPQQAEEQRNQPRNMLGRGGQPNSSLVGLEEDEGTVTRSYTRSRRIEIISKVYSRPRLDDRVSVGIPSLPKLFVLTAGRASEQRNRSWRLCSDLI